MLRYVFAQELSAYPLLARTMFQDRADQFAKRLGWSVTVDCHGQERDEYDAANPLYVIWQGADGRHQGSMRLLPMSGPTMIADHFAYLEGDKPIRRDDVWECSRFCLSRQAGSHIASMLMLAGGEVMRRLNVAHFLGVFDQRMTRVYRRIGALPQTLAAHGDGGDRTSLGLWSFNEKCRQNIMRRHRITEAQLDHWFDGGASLKLA